MHLFLACLREPRSLSTCEAAWLDTKGNSAAVAASFGIKLDCDGNEGRISSDVAKISTMSARFETPAIQDNPSGWGPNTIPPQFKDMPYQPFSKSDRLGKVRLRRHFCHESLPA